MNHDEKLRRLKELKEVDFRHNVVHPLFGALGYKDYRDVHGNDELGLDAICTDTDKLGSVQLIGIQTKRGDLKMSSAASDNVATVITQLRTAITTKHPLPSLQGKRIPDKVYCVASGTINRRAQEHIIEELARDARIDFLDAGNLIGLIDENCPEIWTKLPGALIAYYAGIKHKIEQVDPSDNLAIHADTGSFIGLKLYQTTMKQTQGKKTPTLDEFNITELIRRINPRKPALILADAGSGKSTLLWRIAYDIVDRANRKKYLIPIVLRARDVVECADEHTFWEFCQGQAAAIGTEPPFLKNKIPYEHLLLLIDALDEISDDEKIERCVDNIVQWTRDRQAMLCCTSRAAPRKHRFGQIYNIAPISVNQARKLFTRALQRRKGMTQQTQDQLVKIARSVLNQLDHMYGFHLSPLLVNIYAETAEVQKTDIPPNITELFDKYVETMLGRWDQSKGIALQFHIPLKKFLLAHVAFGMHEDRHWEIGEKEFKNRVTNFLEERGIDTDDSENVYDEIRRSRLITYKPEGVSFSHPMLQEFFAGIAIQDSAYINKQVAKRHWSKAIMFYFGSSSDRTGELKEVLGHTAKKQLVRFDEEAIRLRTVGISLQTCYRGLANDRIEIWEDLIKRLASLTQKFLSNLPESLFPIHEWVYYSLDMRYAVPLSLLKNKKFTERLWEKAGSTTGEDHETDMYLFFWRIIALIDCDMFSEVSEQKLLSKITNNYLKLFLHFLFKTHKIVDSTVDNKRQMHQLIREMESNWKQDIDRLIGGARKEMIKIMNNTHMVHNGDR